MKRLFLVFLALFLVVSFSQPMQADAKKGEMHKGWKKVKKNAQKNVKKITGKKLKNYIKFNKGLGPTLSKLEKDPKSKKLKKKAIKILNEYISRVKGAKYEGDDKKVKAFQAYQAKLMLKLKALKKEVDAFGG